MDKLEPFLLPVSTQCLPQLGSSSSQLVKGKMFQVMEESPALASIHSLTEETFMQEYLGKKSLLPFHTKSWIGAKNVADKWVWEDGTDFNYSKGLDSWGSPMFWNSHKKE